MSTMNKEELRKQIIKIVNDMTPDYDEELLDLINQQVLLVLAEAKKQKQESVIGAYSIDVVPISAIEEIERRYKS